MTERVEVVIVGAGLVGLTAAWELTERFPGKKILIIEKEAHVALHQSGRNSGVIHSGVYYKPGSLKASCCLEGRKLLLTFCEERQVPVLRRGKLIIAHDAEEESRLQRLEGNAQAHGIPYQVLPREGIKELEPYAEGKSALYLPEVEVTDYREVAKALKRALEGRGVQFRFERKVQTISTLSRYSQILLTSGEVVYGDAVLVCAGLYSDTLLPLPGIQIMPFRGEYYLVRPERASLCRGLLYPTPHPRFPFLGVHFTRGVHDEVDVGPTACLAFAREGYTVFQINWQELFHSLRFPGLRKFIANALPETGQELLRSLSKQAVLKAARRLIPDIQEHDIIKAQSGVRAQAMREDGTLVDDFLWKKEGNCVYIVNAPSPAATSAFSIAKHIVKVLEQN